MCSPDHIIARVDAWLRHAGLSIYAAGRLAGLSEHTVAAVVRRGQGRIETLRRLHDLVPVDFHEPSEVGGTEQDQDHRPGNTTQAENCEAA